MIGLTADVLFRAPRKYIAEYMPGDELLPLTALMGVAGIEDRRFARIFFSSGHNIQILTKIRLLEMHHFVKKLKIASQPTPLIQSVSPPPRLKSDFLVYIYPVKDIPMSKAERTKQFIIEQAAPIFNEKGIAGTSIDDVLHAAKVAKGCLYNHFENKEALSNETADFLLKKITGRIGAVMSKETSAKAKIFAYLDFSKNPLNTFIEGGCPILNMAVEADDNNPAIKQKVRDTMVAGQKMFSAILKEGIKNGEFTNALDPEEFAFKLFTAIEGATVVCRVLDSVKPMLSLIKNLKKELAGFEPE